MTLTLCHTADWHLGRTLHGISLEPIQHRFLAWLLDRLVESRVDVLVVAGDVFDRSVPSASAEQLFFRFLADLRARAPGLEVIVVAGNHDGASRLAAPAPVLERLGVRIVGSLPTRTREDGTPGLDLAAVVVPLRDRAGLVRGRLLALPFLRPSDLSFVDAVGAEDGPLARVRALHRAAVAAAGAAPGLLTIATAHAHVRGARLSPDSERVLLGGEEAAWPLDVFPTELDYVALGHLHLAQGLDGGRVRYSGAPMPLAFSERDHPHEIVLLREIGDGMLAAEEERVGRLAVRAVPVPPFLRLVRVEGEEGARLGVEEAVVALRALAESAEGSLEAQEVWAQARVRLDGAPRPALKQELTQALASSPLARREVAPRLCHVDVERPSVDAARASALPSALSPAAVLEHVWRTSGGRADEPVPSALRHALDAAWLEAVRSEDEDAAGRPEEVAS